MQSATPQPKVYQARCLPPGNSIIIDGRGQDPNWHSAQSLTDFTFPWIQRIAPATDFRAVWNAQQFYFRYVVVDSDIVLGEGANARQKVIGSDRVEIFFSTGPALNPYYGLEMDPRGEVLAYAAKFHRQMDWPWTCPGLEVATSRTPDGYIVEGCIPLATFRQLACLHRDESGDYLIAGLYRAEFSSPAAGEPVIEDWMSWVDPCVATPDFHVPTSFGTIRLSH